MWRFGFLHVKAWPSPSFTLLCLLIMLQMGAWYPLWQSRQSAQQVASSQASRWEGISAQQLAQNQKLVAGNFASNSVSTRVVNSHSGSVTQWSVSGKMSLVDWQVWQEKLQEQVAVGLTQAQWHFSMDGQWHGELLFDVLRPMASRAPHDWLPIGVSVLPKGLAKWRLVLVVVENGEASALLSYGVNKRWVESGDWLPELSLSIARITPDEVTLRALSGEKLSLFVGGFNGVKE
ncbi:hypothetical protein [Marinomonas pollencensis]|uniref:Uncharacterized protein n=1 Tax=Marinomonas pollencensis TaxID=491954 RepID=A0A3E0DI18_9GAMM|nr:hypothetical protein [Marinomonas pollencensis]REG82361.1 hypothetical protein DFP81_10920 [Marinomonas pollencensis]